MRPAKLSILALLAFCALLHTGCASVFFSTVNIQPVTIVADDDDEYDFYVNGVLKCENTSECTVYRSTYGRCKMSIEASRDGVILGSEKYGYWHDPSFIEQMFRMTTKRKKSAPRAFSAGRKRS